MEKKIIKVLDFTEDPGPRYIRQDKVGEYTSGEAFYLIKLNDAFTQCYRERKQLIIELDGVSGYPSSFLDEAIGELVYDFSLDVVSIFLDFETVMYKKRVQQVKDETYKQWEERRNNRDFVTHSPNIDYTIHYLAEDGSIKERKV